MEEGRIGRLVLRQLGVWFGLPIAVAILVSMVVIAYFLQTVSAEIAAYIGFRHPDGTDRCDGGDPDTAADLLFSLSTWLLFKRP